MDSSICNFSKSSEQTSKRLNGGTLGEDRISSLPDPLLLHILSFLDTRHAVLTGILSSRWRGLWTSLPNLHFCKYYRKDDDDSDDDYDDNFSNFVKRSLDLHDRSKIEKFRLCFRYDWRYESHVNSWIRFAVERDVQELELELFGGRSMYTLPFWLFDCEKLISLKLKECRLEVPKFTCFSSLTSISLSRMHLKDGLIQELLDGCPMLEELDMVECECLSCLCISSSSNLRLKRLMLKWCCNRFGLKIQAPNLQVLDFCGYIYNAECSLNDLPDLREAYLNLYSEMRKYESAFLHILESLLKDLRHAKVLKISSACIQVMSIPPLRDLHSDISKTKCLILQTGLQKCELPGIANLLWSSCDLETLIIELIPAKHPLLRQEIVGNYDFDEKEYWDKLTFSFPCLVHHLKTIKISSFLGVTSLIEKQDTTLKLVRFFLKNAMILEKMTIHLSYQPNIVKLKEWQKIIFTISKKLKAIPRVSSCAQVIFSSYY